MLIFFWEEEDSIRKKLIRNTLSNVENQLIKYPEIIRCHRTALVNKIYIEKKISSSGGLQLKLRGVEEVIPVSRQYTFKIKEIKL